MKKYIIILITILISWSNTSVAKEHTIEKAAIYLKEKGMSPNKYLISKFKKADIILLAEDHAVKENLLFIHNLIPELYQNGIYMLGMEFGAYEDQNLLDSLITAPEFDEKLARKIMFNYNVMWPIKEYIDIYKVAWELNKSLPSDVPKFRILNISYKYNWKGFYGKREPENMKKVFYQGNPESFRFSVLEEEVLSKSQKILVLTGTPHAFTFYNFPRYDYTAPGFVHYEYRDLGNLLYKKYGNRILSVALHQPFPNYPNKVPSLISPCNGVIENVFESIGNPSLGFDLKDTPIDDFSDMSYYSMGYSDFTLSKIFDGYIFLKPIRQLSSCTIDINFIEEQSCDEILDNVPDPDWHNYPKTIDEYWKVVYDLLDIPSRYKIFR